MRFVVYGVGAIGGVVGASILGTGADVTFIGRGRQYDAVRQNGLRVEFPDRDLNLDLDIVDNPAAAKFDDQTVTLLCVKTQDSAVALKTLAAIAPPQMPVFCLQNGVESERLAARWHANVYGVSVTCPTGFLEAGLVRAYSAPVTGALDIGRYSGGSDDLAVAVRKVFVDAGFASEIVADISARKYGKMLSNLGNAIEAVCGPSARKGPIDELAMAEGRACLSAAQIRYIEDGSRAGLVTPRLVHGEKRPAGSTWQSLKRNAASAETDYLNGEIAMLGRLHGVSTPVNSALQRHVAHLSTAGNGPGSITEEQFLADLNRGSRRRASTTG